jgi:hypothetical protein
LRDHFLACRKHFRGIEALLVLLAEQSGEDAVLVLELRDLASARGRELAVYPRCRAAERQDDDGHSTCQDGLTTAPSGEFLDGAQLPPPCLPFLGVKARPGDRPVAFHWRMIAVNQVVVTAPALRADVANACFSFDHLGHTGEQ